MGGKGAKLIFWEDPGRLDIEVLREGGLRILVRDEVMLELIVAGSESHISVLGVGGVETVTEDDRD